MPIDGCSAGRDHSASLARITPVHHMSLLENSMQPEEMSCLKYTWYNTRPDKGFRGKMRTANSGWSSSNSIACQKQNSDPGFFFNRLNCFSIFDGCQKSSKASRAT